MERGGESALWKDCLTGKLKLIFQSIDQSINQAYNRAEALLLEDDSGPGSEWLSPWHGQDLLVPPKVPILEPLE